MTYPVMTCRDKSLEIKGVKKLVRTFFHFRSVQHDIIQNQYIDRCEPLSLADHIYNRKPRHEQNRVYPLYFLFPPSVFALIDFTGCYCHETCCQNARIRSTFLHQISPSFPPSLFSPSAIDLRLNRSHVSPIHRFVPFALPTAHTPCQHRQRWNAHLASTPMSHTSLFNQQPVYC